MIGVCDDGAKLRLVCVSEDHSAVAGGVPAVVDQLSRRVADKGVPVSILCVKEQESIVSGKVDMNCVSPVGLGVKWGWSRGLRPTIERLSHPSEHTVFHLHGIWMAPHYVGAKVARERNIPFVVSAHGMLEPWLWKQQGWKVRLKKETYWRLFAYPVLSCADVVHAITPLERDNLRALFPTNRIEVIPNAIDLNETPLVDSRSNREKLILFLGRIDPKKGVDILLNAFAEAKLGNDWRVVVIGPTWSISYQEELARIVSERNLIGRVEFLGAVFGEEKLRWIRKAWVLAVPSHSEAVGLVNLEAAANCVPSITTYQTGLYDWTEGGGLLIEPNVEQMKGALIQASAWTDQEREARGWASRALVCKRYSWEAILPQWMSLYDSLVDRG